MWRRLPEGYELLRELGRGATGTVFLARQTALEREVVVKFLDVGTPEDRERFLREARVLMALRHPGIVQLVDYGETDHGPFLVMIREEGRPLNEVLMQGRLPPAVVVRMSQSLVSGLAEVHRHGILHRDVKPANVLLTAEGEARLLDFGAAVAPRDERLTAKGQVVGTPAYMAPELLRGEPATPAADMYALGVLVIECISGVNPFFAPDLATCLDRHVSLRVTARDRLLTGVVPALAQLIEQLLRKPPLERPSAKEAADRLQRLVEDGIATGADREGRSTVPLAPVPAGLRPAPLPAPPPAPLPEKGPGARVARRERSTRLVQLAAAALTGLAVIWRLRGPAPEPWSAAAPPSAESAAPAASGHLQIYRVIAMVSDDQALVDFDCEGPSAFDVSLTIEGSRIPAHRVGQPAATRFVHQRFTGLGPDTTYLLDVVPRAGRGGLRGFRFTTRNNHREADPAMTASSLRDGDELLGRATLQYIRVNQNPLFVPVLARYLAGTPLTEFLQQEVGLTLVHFRDRELMRGLSAQIGSRSASWSLDDRATLAVAAVTCRAPDAGARARDVLCAFRAAGKIPTEAQALLASELAAPLRGREPMPACLGDLEMLKNNYLASLWLIHADPAAARRHFLKWIRSDPQPSPFALLGVGHVDDDADVPELARFLRGDAPAATREVAAQALAVMSGPRSEAVLREKALARPDDLPLLWCCVQRGVGGLADPLVRLALDAREPEPLRAERLLALGTLAQPGHAPLLRPLLRDRSAILRRNAAYALARLRDKGSLPELRALARSGEDRSGVPVWALGELPDPASAALLEELVRQGGPEEPLAPARRALALLSLFRVDEQRARRLCASAIPHLAHPMERAVTGWIAMDPDVRAGAYPRVVFPFVPLERTGLRCASHDWITCTFAGRWTNAGAVRSSDEPLSARSVRLAIRLGGFRLSESLRREAPPLPPGTSLEVSLSTLFGPAPGPHAQGAREGAAIVIVRIPPPER